MKILIEVILECFIGEVYRLHPYNNPPRIKEIRDYLENKLYNYSFGECSIKVTKFKELVELLRGILIKNLYFRQLSISKSRWDQGQRDVYEKYENKSQDNQENRAINTFYLISKTAQDSITLTRGYSIGCSTCEFFYNSQDGKECMKCIISGSNYLDHA